MNRKYGRAHILFEESGSVMTIELRTGKIMNYLFHRPIHTNYKTSDTCEILFERDDSKLCRYQGYVPRVFPGQHFGDYIEFSVGRDGNIQGFSITDEQIDDLISRSLPFLCTCAHNGPCPENSNGGGE